MTNLNRRLAELATGQLGSFSREQARDVGATDDQLRSRVMSGFLAQPGPNVYRFPLASDAPRSALNALILDIGGDVVASRHTAAALHGFDGHQLQAPFDFTVGRERRVTRLGHRVHQVADLDLIDRGTEHDIPVTRAARTLIDLARTDSPEQLRVALDSALRDRKVTERSLHERIVALRRSGRHGIRALLLVIEGKEAVSGAHSWLEREFLRLLHEEGMALPTPQRVLTRSGERLVRVDFHFPATDIVVEVLGYTWHSSPAQLRRDTERMNALLDSGVRPYQFTYNAIVETPSAVVADVRRALGA